MKLQLSLILVLLVLVQSVWAETNHKNHTGNQSGKIHLKWVLAHEPVDIFLPAAKRFSEEVSKNSEGAISIEILSLPEYSKKYNKGKSLTSGEVAGLVRKGDIEMSQTYTTTLAMSFTPLMALDLPFLFKDHDHATRVLDGKIGKNLLDGLSLSDMKGLAFTYSGGYRIMPGRKPVEHIDDFKGMSVTTSNSPVARDLFVLMGAHPVQGNPFREFSGIFDDKKMDMAELTYARVGAIKNMFTRGDVKFINETNHSLFLTAIILNERIWNSMSAAQQEVIQAAALSAAAYERKTALEANIKATKELQDAGFKIVHMEKSEVEKWRALVAPIYEKYGRLLGKDLIESIQKEATSKSLANAH
jgi:TRAP-type C4-dicarboxylate transport system substrate-binding protein